MIDLNDIVMTDPISMAPATVAWLVLLLVVLVALAATARYVLKRYGRNAYRREALRLVETMPLHELPALVKRVALAQAPRTEVASLTGDEWLAYLDRTYGGSEFTNGPGRLLATASFAPEPDDLGESERALRELVSIWVRKHRV